MAAAAPAAQAPSEPDLEEGGDAEGPAAIAASTVLDAYRVAPQTGFGFPFFQKTDTEMFDLEHLATEQRSSNRLGHWQAARSTQQR